MFFKLQIKQSDRLVNYCPSHGLTDNGAFRPRPSRFNS